MDYSFNVPDLVAPAITAAFGGMALFIGAKVRDAVDHAVTALMTRIDALKDAISQINTTLGRADERHTALTGDVRAIENRVEKIEAALFRIRS